MTMVAPCVVVSGARAPAALHACRALTAAGYRVVAVDSLRFPVARFSKSVAAFESVASPVFNPEGFAQDVERVLKAHNPVRWIPTCEEIFHLAALTRRLPALAHLLWAPALGALTAAHNKHTFADVARALDGGEVDTHLLTSPEHLQAVRGLSRRLVFKPVYSRFAEHVLIRPFADGLERVQPSAHSPWVAQTYLPGEELCAYAIAHRGQVVAQSLYKGLYHAGQGASVFFEPTVDARIEAFVTAFVTQTHWHGQVAFDFRREAGGRPVAIECNPRATSGIHLWQPDEALGHALMGEQGQALTPAPAPPMVGVAMLGAALKAPLGRWWTNWRQGKDVLQAVSDPGLLPGQALALMELAWRSRRHRFSLAATSTADIQWNGETALKAQGDEG